VGGAALLFCAFTALGTALQLGTLVNNTALTVVFMAGAAAGLLISLHRLGSSRWAWQTIKWLVTYGLVWGTFTGAYAARLQALSTFPPTDAGAELQAHQPIAVFVLSAGTAVWFVLGAFLTILLHRYPPSGRRRE